MHDWSVLFSSEKNTVWERLESMQTDLGGSRRTFCCVTKNDCMSS